MIYIIGKKNFMSSVQVCHQVILFIVDDAGSGAQSPELEAHIQSARAINLEMNFYIKYDKN